MKRAAFVGGGLGVLGALPLRALAQSASLRLGSVPVESYALAYYAAQAGFFTKAGLDVAITSFHGGGAITSGVAGGALDIGCANVGSLSNAHARGLPIRIIAPGGLYSSAKPTTVLAVGKNSPLTGLKELAGKTVGVSTLKDLQQISIMRAVHAAGADPMTVKFIELPIPEMPSALNARRIDAGIVLEPTLSFARDQVRVLAHTYDTIAKTFMISAFFSTDGWLSKNGQTAHRLVAALEKSAQWANANQAASGAILEQVAKLPPGGAARMTRTVFGERLDPDYVQPVIDALAEYAYLPKAFSASEMFWNG